MFKRTVPTEADEIYGAYEAGLGENALSLAKHERDPARFRGRLEYARWCYDRVLRSYPGTRGAERTRIGLAEIDWLEGNAKAALDELAAIAAHGRDPDHRRFAGDIAVAVYADVADPQLARAFFVALDPARAEVRLDLLVDRYRNNGKPAEAMIVDSQRRP